MTLGFGVDLSFHRMTHVFHAIRILSQNRFNIANNHVLSVTLMWMKSADATM